MFKFLRKHRTVMMIALAASFLGLLLFGIGGTSFTASPQDTIIKINGQKVTQAEFDRIYNQMLRSRPEMTPEQRSKLTGDVLNELIRQEVFYQESRRYNIRVSDTELQYQIASIPAFQREGKFDPRVYVQAIRQTFGMTPRQFEDFRRKDMAARKMNRLISSAVHISDADFQQLLQRRLAIETDPEAKKELRENPEKLRQEIENQEINLVYQDWLTQLNSKLKVQIVSDTFRKRLQGQS